MGTKSYQKMSDIMDGLVNMGYSKGDEIPYYDYVETCYSLGLEPDDDEIDITYMEQIYDIAIG